MHHDVDQPVRRRVVAALLAQIAARIAARHGPSVGSAPWTRPPAGSSRSIATSGPPLRAATPLTLREDDLAKLRGINERIDLDEVAAIYLPLSRLLNLYVSASQDLARVSSTFLGTMAPRVPYVIGVAGSVAVGKSTFARILQALLARWPDHPQVDLVTTDGFLHPNAVLLERGLMERKGFPESYDTRRLLAFLRDLKSGADEVRAPVYSHVVYDIVAGRGGRRAPPGHPDPRGAQRAAGVDRSGPSSSATTSTSRSTSTPTRRTSASGTCSGSSPSARRCSRTRNSFFRHFADLSDEEAGRRREHIWDSINGRNLRENIPPTRERASLILRKDADHRVTEVRLHKL